MTIEESLTIRRAGDADALALLQLAELDSAQPLAGEIVLAEVDGEPWAALELASGRAVADPFRPSAEIVELLRLRAARIGEAGGAQRRRPLLGRYATRWGYSASTSAR